MKAAAGSLLFLAVAPGVVAGLAPWWLTGWDADGTVPWPVVAAGVVLTVAGIAFLLHAFGRFVLEGLGTPAPVAPTERLVVGGRANVVRGDWRRARATLPSHIAVNVRHADRGPPRATLPSHTPANLARAQGSLARACRALSPSATAHSVPAVR